MDFGKITQLDFRLDSFNIGVNIGEVAGLLVFHVHLHIIPRYKGDVEDPKGVGERFPADRNTETLINLCPG